MLREGGLTVLNQVLVGSLKLLDFLILLVVTPVVTFYLLLDWDRMLREINQILPRQHAPTIRRLARDIDQVLAGFVRGQLSVCLVLGVFYAVALMAIGLQFGFLVGLVAGLDLVRSLRRLGRRAPALGRHRALPVLGRQVLDAGDGGDLLLRPVRRGQHPVAEPDRQVGGAASGLADPGARRCSARSSASPGSSSRCRCRRRSACSGASSSSGTGRARSIPGSVPPGRRRRALTAPRQLVLDLPARPALGRADFFVSPSNELALAQVDAWPAWPAGRLARGRARGGGQDAPRPCLGGAERGAHPVGDPAAARPRRAARGRGARGRGRGPAGGGRRASRRRSSTSATVWRRAGAA